MTEEKMETTEESTHQETTETGEKELDIQVGLENGKVILMFSQSLASVALPPDSAVTMASAMLHYAKQAASD